MSNTSKAAVVGLAAVALSMSFQSATADDSVKMAKIAAIAKKVIRMVAERKSLGTIQEWISQTGEPIEVAITRPVNMSSIAAQHVNWASHVKISLSQRCDPQIQRDITACAEQLNAIVSFHSIGLEPEQTRNIREQVALVTTPGYQVPSGDSISPPKQN